MMIIRSLNLLDYYMAMYIHHFMNNSEREALVKLIFQVKTLRLRVYKPKRHTNSTLHLFADLLLAE